MMVVTMVAMAVTTETVTVTEMVGMTDQINSPEERGNA